MLKKCIPSLSFLTIMLLSISIAHASDLASIDCYYSGKDDAEFAKILIKLVSRVPDMSVTDINGSVVTVEYGDFSYICTSWMLESGNVDDTLRVGLMLFFPNQDGSQRKGMHLKINELNLLCAPLKLYWTDPCVVFERTILFRNLLNAEMLKSAMDRVLADSGEAMRNLSEEERAFFE